MIDLAIRVTIDDPGDHVCQIGHRLDSVDLGRFDERGNVLGSSVGAGEERILPIERDRPD